MQSRRECKRDSRFDRLLQQLYGDLQGFEAQVLIYYSSMSCVEREGCEGMYHVQSPGQFSAHCRAHL